MLIIWKEGGVLLSNQSSKLFMKGALTLTIAALAVKVLSAVYRIPFQNIVGDVGFYIYQQVYPIYGIAVAFSTYGFPVAISKLIAQGEERDRSRILTASFVFLSLVGVLLFLALYFQAKTIAAVMGDLKLARLIQIISLSFLMMPFLSVARGLFQGKGDMVPTAVSQVTEQLIRVGAILGFSYLFVHLGSNLYTVGESALFGSIMGGLASSIVLIFFLKHRRESIFRVQHFSFGVMERRFIQTLALEGIAICLSSMMLVLFQFMDALSLYSSLVDSGISKSAAKVVKGIYDRGQPLLQVGTVVATSFSLTLVPIISASYQENDYESVHKSIRIAVKISFVIGLAAMAGLLNILVPTNIMLFENQSGSDILAFFSVGILLSSMAITFSGILQGVGSPYFPAIVLVIGLVAKYVGNLYLVHLFGAVGAAFSTVLSLLLTSLILFLKIKAFMRIQVLTWSFVGQSLLAAAAMTALLQVWSFLFRYLDFSSTRLHAAVESIGGVFLGGTVFLILILKMKLFTKEELALFPLGGKLVQIGEKLNGRNE
jgi:PST family polysaccharide transporter